MFTIELNSNNFDSIIQDTELEKGDVIVIGKVRFFELGAFWTAMKEKYEYAVLSRYGAHWEGRWKGSVTKISILSKKEVVIQETMGHEFTVTPNL